MKKFDIEKELKKTKDKDIVAVILVIRKNKKMLGIRRIAANPDDMIDTLKFVNDSAFEIKTELKKRGYELEDNIQMFR